MIFMHLITSPFIKILFHCSFAVVSTLDPYLSSLLYYSTHNNYNNLMLLSMKARVGRGSSQGPLAYKSEARAEDPQASMSSTPDNNI